MTGGGAPVDLLVIDAVPERHGTYRDVLRDIARNVVTVVSGEEARQQAKANDFAAVLVHLDGVHDASAALGKLNPPTGPPLIVISERIPDLTADSRPSPTVTEYVPAPFMTELLPTRLSCVLELARLKNEMAQRDERIGELSRQIEQMDVAVADERRASDALRSRVGEQIHRSKNLLAIMQSLVHRTISDGRAISDARETLAGRFRALARAYQLITSANGQGVDIADVVEAELADVAHRVTASGPPARLAGSMVQTFALALHELSINATKHGALRSPEGSISLGWTFFEYGPDRYLEVAWTERGGAPPTTPSHYGFGLTLVSSFAGSGASTPNVTFDEGGLACRLRVSQDRIVPN